MHFIYLTSIDYLEPPINLTVSGSQSNQSEPTQGQGEHGNPPKKGWASQEIQTQTLLAVWCQIRTLLQKTFLISRVILSWK